MCEKEVLVDEEQGGCPPPSVPPRPEGHGRQVPQFRHRFRM